MSQIEADVSTTLAVLGSHGVELEGIRNESARQRGVDDAVRAEMAERTRDRFTSRDGDNHMKIINSLESRLQRLEDWRIENNKHERER